MPKNSSFLSINQNGNLDIYTVNNCVGKTHPTTYLDTTIIEIAENLLGLNLGPCF